MDGPAELIDSSMTTGGSGGAVRFRSPDARQTGAPPMSTSVDSCRICASTALQLVLDLGDQPLANGLRADRETTQPIFPLIVCRCERCGTVQLTETVSPGLLFKRYVWTTGTSDAVREYSRTFCERLVSRSRPGPLFVVEVASNDGTFLKPFAERGDRVLGVDPAENIAAMAEQSGVPTIAEFFGAGVAGRIAARGGPADVVFARNVISHVADVNDVMAGIARCLREDGTGAIEFHRADVILDELHYDSIYHEHLFYHSLHSIEQLLERFALIPFDIATSSISGGSLIVYFSKTRRNGSEALDSMRERERRLGVAHAEPWRQFAERSLRHREKLRGLVDAAVARGRVIGYGASARSATLMSCCGIDARHLRTIADRSPLKHGLFAPGTGIEIVAPARAFADRPDAILLLAWNFRDEILAHIRADHDWHGEVILPLPGDPTPVRL
jgi:SAM-dependent methyltransferase